MLAGALALWPSQQIQLYACRIGLPATLWLLAVKFLPSFLLNQSYKQGAVWSEGLLKTL